MSNDVFNEYAIEKGLVNREKLRAGRLDRDGYNAAHQGLIIACHDVFIKYQDRILLVKRDNFPAKGFLWPIGGRIERGLSVEDSLRERAYEECRLHIENLRFLGVDRTLFKTDPLGHGRGTDTINLVYFASGSGTIKLDELHTKPTLVSRADYLQLRNKLHPYVQEYMDGLWSGGQESINPSKILLREWTPFSDSF